jgi:hypothetical protein
LRYADKLLLFIAHDESSSGWVYNILQQLSGEGRRIPVKTVIYIVRNIPRKNGTVLQETFFARLIDSMKNKPGA